MPIATSGSFEWKERFPCCLDGAPYDCTTQWVVWFVLALILTGAAQAEAPPRDYLNLGPNFVVAPGIGSTTEFRDLLLQKAASLRVAGTVTYRGWALSGTLDQSVESTGTRASELLAIYSHKLPNVDLHLGIGHGQIDGDYSSGCTAASATASSNSLPSTILDLTVQNDLSGSCQLISIGASQMLWQHGTHQLNFRASANNWKTDILQTEGWSVRFMGRSQLEANQSVHYQIGYVDSNLKQGPLQSKPSGVTVSINYVWEFR